jgi:hypothetical protein
MTATPATKRQTFDPMDVETAAWIAGAGVTTIDANWSGRRAAFHYSDLRSVRCRLAAQERLSALATMTAPDRGCVKTPPNQLES